MQNYSNSHSRHSSGELDRRMQYNTMPVGSNTNNNSGNINNMAKSLSKVAISEVLDNTSEMFKTLSSDALLNQRAQMQKNNEDLLKYIKFKNDLEKTIQKLKED